MRSELRPGELFVGRRREMERLLAGLQDAEAGRGSLFLLVGEAGIGKSRLADEVARAARDRGARVLWGRCWEAGGAPAFWPWVQALRGLLRDHDRESLLETLGSGAADLGAILPEVRDRVPGTDPPAPSEQDAEGARFRLFDAACSFLIRAAGGAPIVVVLDDLHVADTPSLLLLEFLSREVARGRLFVLGLLRPPTGTEDDAVRRTLAELGREPAVRTITLEGLAREDVHAFVAAAAAGLPPEAAALIHRGTDGNPLFVSEVVRLLHAERSEAGSLDPAQHFAVPETIREAIGRRMAGLDSATVRLLEVASVLGREFHEDLVAVMAGTPAAEVSSLLRPAVEVGAITAWEGAVGPRSWRFAHVLVRETLYDRMAPDDRRRLHASAAEVLEAEADEERMAELAHHAYLALPTGDRARAASLARTAGERAVGLLAYEEATRLFAMALRALEGEPEADLERCDLLLAQGDAQARAGELAASRDTFLRAATLARRLGAVDRLARAAFGYGGRFAWIRAAGDLHLVPLLREAIAALGDRNPHLRVRLMGRLAGALRDEAEMEERSRLAAEALALARSTGDGATIAYALVARYTAIWGPDGLEEMDAIATELAELAEVIGDPERVMDGLWLRLVVLLNRGGDRSVAQRIAETYHRMAEDLRQPSQRWYAGVMRTLLAVSDGRLDEAERLSGETRLLGGRAHAWDATVSHRMAMFLIRREQGRLEEVEDEIRRSLVEHPGYRLFRCLLAQLLAETGRLEEARTAIASVLDAGELGLPRDSGYLFGMVALADACRPVEHREMAERIHAALLPHGALVANATGEVGSGSVWRPLGVLAGMLGRTAEAEAHLGRALVADARMDARPWMAHSQYELARVLLQRGDRGDRSRAERLLDEADRAAIRMGMTLLRSRVASVRETAPRARTEGTEGGAAHATFVRAGEYWTISFDGAELRLHDSKGLRYLSRLLSNPGREVPAIDLVVSPGPGPAVLRTADAGAEALHEAGDLGEVLDASARAAYRRRIAELEEEIEEAEAFGDAGRAERAREERDVILEHLAAAVGLGGRARRAGSPAERARVNVTRAIRSALDRISAASPELGRHLEATIRTGSLCSYMPDPRAPVAWRT